MLKNQSNIANGQLYIERTGDQDIPQNLSMTYKVLYFFMGSK